MKKGISFFLIAALFITTWLWFVKNSSIGSQGEVIQKQNEEINLNTFIEKYEANIYEKVELLDATKLKWYEVLTWEIKPNILGIKADKKYKIRETNKPVDTSLPELWFKLNGDIPIEVTYDETGFSRNYY